jgi:hypothetical protein
LKRNFVFVLLLAVFVSAGAAVMRADIFGAVRGIVHDPQHRPIAGAKIVLSSATSSYSLTTTSNQDGEFTFNPVPLGDYKITVSQTGFQTASEALTVASDSSPILHFPLSIGSINQTATVTASASAASVQTVTPTTLVDRNDIAETPGADRSNGLEMITDYVPAAYVTHDMLHMRGGHQVDWLIDGVPIPNTNIATNLGPVIDPKDIDYLEIQRGSYDADYGDRTYGIFNVVPRNGFESDNEAEIVTSFGDWYQTNDQINLGGHTEKFAYYASINGNRSNYGLATPIGQVFHDAESGGGAFISLIYNPDPRNQFRLVASIRGDYYQIPYDPDPNSAENQVYNTSQLRDAEPACQLWWLAGGHRRARREKRRAIRNVRIRAAPKQLFQQHLHRRQRKLSRVLGLSNRRPLGRIRYGQIQTDLVADRHWRPSPIALRFTRIRHATGGGRRERDRSPRRRGSQNPAHQLGLSRFLRRFLPGPAAAHGDRPAARSGNQPKPGFRSSAGRAR